MKEQVKNSILQTGKLDGVKWFTKGLIVVVIGFSSFVKKEELGVRNMLQRPSVSGLAIFSLPGCKFKHYKTILVEQIFFLWTFSSKTIFFSIISMTIKNLIVDVHLLINS